MQTTRDPVALATDLLAFLGDVVVFLAIAAVIYVPARYVVVPATRRALDWAAVSDTWQLPFLKLEHAAFGILAVFAATNLSGFSQFLQTTEALVAGITVAVGFASRDVLGNLVSGVFIVVDPEFEIGDWIAWNDKEGIIEDISFRVTRVHTFDNELISVPNAELTKNAVVNPVAKDTLRVRNTFCVGYDADLDRAKTIVVEAARERDSILDRPAPSVRLMELADSCIELEARFWIENPARTDFVRIRSEYVQDVRDRFDRADIDMPYPTREITGSLTTHTTTTEHR